MKVTDSASNIQEYVRNVCLKYRSIDRTLGSEEFKEAWSSVSSEEKQEIINLINVPDPKGLMKYLRSLKELHYTLWERSRLAIYAGSRGVKNICRLTRDELILEIQRIKELEHAEE